MKKILAMVLAMMLVLSMSAAFAEDVETVNFTKTYTVVGETAENPAETFEFENIAFVEATNTGVGYDAEEAAENLPTIATVSYTKGEATAEKDFVISLPEYEIVGIYTYSFNEVDNNVEGVEYDTTSMKLVVTVVQNADGSLSRSAAIHCAGDGEDEEGNEIKKTDKFANTYTAGTLAVTKTTTGNMADRNQEFDIKITLTSDGDTVMSDIYYTDPDDGVKTTVAAAEGWTSKTIEVTMNHGETITFENIPAGVSYVVEETNAYEHTPSYDANKTGKFEADEDFTTTITNEKSATVDTGISLDNAPYMILMALVVIAGAALIVKRASANR